MANKKAVPVGPPDKIVVWACTEPGCGYWRQEESTGVHVTWDATARRGIGGDARHKLTQVEYEITASEASRFEGVGLAATAKGA